ncbi:MAG TPA: class II aldolase/adducin family protein [Stellaceae bacterium]|nr:class II aldolase/adducin family protein [Stellaceae bacterium]
MKSSLVAFAVALGMIGAARAADAPTNAALIEDIVVGNHILYDQAVVDGFGHLSGRNPQNAGHFFMARAVAPGLVTADDIMEFDLDGKAIDARGRRPYVERFIHAEVYRARPDVMAVVHSHSPGVLPFGVSQTPLRAMVMTGSFLGDGAPVFDAAAAGGTFGFLINTPELGKALAKTLGNGTVVLMRAHGDTVVGRGVRQAVSNAIYTEIAARLEMQALSLGSHITWLSPQEIKNQETVANSPNITGGGDRTWDMWKAQAERHSR